jgi:tellurite resistance protein TerC
LAFAGGVTALLILDLGVLNRKSHAITLREAAISTAVWFSLALAFNALMWWWAGHEAGIVFLTGYLTEWSLSMDNVFVFAVIFSYFGVPRKYQHRVLFWGILGAVLMRLTFFFVGAELLERFHWMMYVFGAFLVYTGLKLAFSHGSDVDPETNPVLRVAHKLLPVAKGDHGQNFFIRQQGKLMVTPLFLVLLVVESTDVLFAVDSVPAIFGVISHMGLGFFELGFFLGFTSNIFAILGLRALYFLLAGVMNMFRYLHYGLSAILVFIGLKMLVSTWWHPPTWFPLTIVLGLLAVSIGASLIAQARDRRRGMTGETAENQSIVHTATGEEPPIP